MASLILLDAKLGKKACFFIYALENNSSDIFKRIIVSLESFFDIQLTNISFCIENCWRKRSCCKDTTQEDKTEEDKKRIHKLFDFKPHITNEDVTDFKSFLYKKVK